MNKQEFLGKLKTNLSGLPEKEVQDSLGFYSEMIDDRMEEGLSEEDAIRDIGSAEEIAKQIIAETPLIKIVKNKIKPKRTIAAWETVLLILGAPIWLSLLIAAFAVILAVYVSVWAIIIAFWSVFASFAACFISGVLACVIFTISGNGISGLTVLAVGIVCAGLSIFTFYGCKATTKSALILTKKTVTWTKNCFIKKEGAS